MATAKRVPVLVGTTWTGNTRTDHFRVSPALVGLDSSKARIFDGRDGVIISEPRGIGVRGCWAEIYLHPRRIEHLVGRKGLAFLKILTPRRVTSFVTTPTHSRRKEAETLFTELRVISAWEFSLDVSPTLGDRARRVVLQVLRTHLRRPTKKVEWVLE